MADGAIYITPHTENVQTVLQKKLYSLINDEQARIDANKKIAECINKYVPEQSGELRESVQVDSQTISWHTPYARYQYSGEVYGPNHPLMYKGTIYGWSTPRGPEKYPTGRELGTPGEWKGWVFGYSTYGTGHHWDEKMLENDRRTMNIKVTASLKKSAKRLGL